MAIPILIRQLLTQSDASGSRSTVLKPLSWLLGILLGGLGLALFQQAPFWILVFIAVMIGFSLIIFFFTYIYCLLHDKDALRSETYSIQKLAIEKGVVGDHISGLFAEDRAEYIEAKTNVIQQSQQDQQ